MRAGVIILPEHRWWVGEHKWRGAESYGFNHAWTYDHIGWKSLVDGPWFDAMATLTAAAQVTTTIRLGTLVASPNFRHPVPFARQLLSVDDVSDGRFILGVGAGQPAEYDAAVLGNADLTPAQRHDRFAEFVELTNALLTRDKTTWRGEYYAALDARMAPGCVQQPRVPFVVAATGPKGMRVAARFGQGWITTGTVRDEIDGWWKSLREQCSRFDEAVAEAPRARARVDKYLFLDASPVYSLSSVECYRDMVGRATELGFTDVISHWPRHDGVYAGSEQVLEAVADEVLPTLC